MTPREDNSSTTGVNAEISRRRLLQVGGAGALTLGLGGVLAACGGGSDSTGGGGVTGGGGGGKPTPGGTLRIGATGGGVGDIVETQNALTTVDFIRTGALSEQLMKLNAKTGAPEPVLAESVEPNKDATEWTIRVLPDVLFHNGKPLTAKDVLYSLRRIEGEEFHGLASLGPVNLKAAKVMDDLTVRIPFHSPFSVFPEGLAGSYTNRIVPEGFDVNSPVGTGPFKFKSFTPGKESTFLKFEDYRESGKPFVDVLEVINFADETAQVNALQAGQVDLVNQLASPSIAPIEGNGGKVTVSKTAAFTCLVMRVDKDPFTDVRVRQAMRLLVNRQQTNDQVFSGLGTIGKDIFGSITPAFKSIPEREQDIEEAKSLLKAAGQENLTVTLYTSPISPGSEATATLFVTQAAEAGVTVKLVNQNPTQYFAQSYGKVPFMTSFWTVASYLIEAAQGIAKGAPFDEIHQTDPGWQKLYEEAISTVDEAKREEITEELMKFDYEKGGYIVACEYPTIEGMSSSVEGVTENISGYPINGGSDMQNIWISS